VIDSSKVSRYCKVLELSPDFTMQQLKIAYKRSVNKWHPDRNKDPNATSIMQEVISGYSYLSENWNEIQSFTPFTTQAKHNRKEYYNPSKDVFKEQFTTAKPRPPSELKFPTIYRQYASVPKRIEIPKNLFKKNTTIFMMIGNGIHSWEAKIIIPEDDIECRATISRMNEVHHITIAARQEM
jgi:hypothetical protein